VTSADFDFARAIAPIQVDTFFHEYWEKRPLVVSRQRPDYYTNLVTMADIDLIIYSLQPDWKTLRLVKQGGFFAQNFIYTWSDLLSGMLRSLSQQDVAFRRALPAGFIRDSQIKNYLEAQFQELLQFLGTQAKLESGIEKLTDSLLENMKNPLPDGYFRRIDNLSQMNLETIVQKRKGTLFSIIPNENSITVKYFSKKLEISKKFAAAIDYINTNNKFSIKDLPSIDDNSKLEFVHRLIGSGLLTIVEEDTGGLS
jgi:hypothetical protein